MIPGRYKIQMTIPGIQDPLPTLLFLRLPLCCFCDPLCCFCGPLCWNVFPFCWFGDPFCCFWSAKWECVFPKCHPPSRMLILYLSRINNSGPSKAKNQQFLSNKTESTNCADQSLVGSFQACRWEEREVWFERSDCKAWGDWKECEDVQTKM